MPKVKGCSNRYAFDLEDRYTLTLGHTPIHASSGNPPPEPNSNIRCYPVGPRALSQNVTTVPAYDDQHKLIMSPESDPAHPYASAKGWRGRPRKARAEMAL